MADTVQNSITVGLIGNPNCGKTTLFNAFTGAKLKTANWPGVTVERTEGEIIWNGQNVHLIDLPGIYSLDSYTIEEKVAEKFLEEGEADVIINIADASLLERSLYLTMQLLELKKPVVLALNMMDGAESKRTELDVKALSEGLGQIPVVPLSAKSRIGLDILMDTVEKVSQERKTGGVLHSAVLKSDRSQSKAEFIERLVWTVRQNRSRWIPGGSGLYGLDRWVSDPSCFGYSAISGNYGGSILADFYCGRLSQRLFSGRPG